MMKRKSIINGFILLSLMFLMGCKDISISAKPVTVEVGGSIPENVLDYINIEPEFEKKVCKKAELDISGINIMSVGEYEAVVQYGQSILIVPVRVVDTIAPVVQVKDVEFKEGDVVIAEDLVDVSDYSNTSLYILNGVNGVKLSHVVLRPGIAVTIEAVDIFGNETVTEIMPKVSEEKREYVPEGRSYESSASFPYGELELIDDDVYAVIKEAYTAIEWDGEFERGNIEQYAVYKEKFKELLDGEIKFLKTERYTYSEVSDWMYLQEFLNIDENYNPAEIFDGSDHGFELYFFDVDGDKAPELCIVEKVGAGAVRSVSIYKYEIDSDRVILWKTYNGPYSQLMGTKMIGVYWEGRQFRLEKFGLNGKNEMTVEFMNEFFSSNGKECYFVSFPNYADPAQQIKLNDKIKRQGYFDESEKLFFFHVTGEQYRELTDAFFKAYFKADEEREMITYTYEELMGQYNTPRESEQ